MQKKIILAEELEKTLRDMRSHMPKFIMADIKSNNTSILKNPNICYDEQLLNIVSSRFSHICDNFNDDILSYSKEEIFNKIGKLMQICQAKERNIRPQLEKICFNGIVELFDIPEDTVSISLNLLEDIEQGKSFNVQPKTGTENAYEQFSDIEHEAKEVQKKRFLNILITGAAISLTNAGLKKILPDLFDLDEELPHLYSKILKVNEYFNFVNNIKITDRNPQQAGYEEVTLGTSNSQPSVKAYGLILPILLQEAIRGLLELCISNGLPDDENFAKLIIDKADALMYEPWDERIGPELWRFFMETSGCMANTKIIPMMLSNLSSLDTDDILDFARENLSFTKNAKRMNMRLFQMTKHDVEYDGFQDRIMKKQNDADVIEDEYFEEDEL